MNERFESPLDSAINCIVKAKDKQGYSRLLDLCEAVGFIDSEIRSLQNSKSKYPIGEHTD